MYAGHLFEWKGANVLLDVARNFQNKEKILFVFVGGTEVDVKKFKEKAAGLDNVLILGQRPRKEIPLYLKSADVLVLPNIAKDKISEFYTSPLKLFEYMASRRPIIASNIPSLREVLNENDALFFEPSDAENLAGKIGNVVDNLSTTDVGSQNAYNKVLDYTWEKRAKNILNFIENGQVS